MVGPFSDIGPKGLMHLPSHEVDAPGYSALIGSITRLENFIGQGAFNLGLRWGNWNTPNDPDYDPYDGVIGTKYERHLRSFGKTKNDLDKRLLMQLIDQEDQDRENLIRAGSKAFIPTFIIGNLDPLLFIPLGKAIKTSSKAENFIKNALKVGTESAAAVSVSESLLQYFQTSRTANESVEAIVGSALLGGLLGGGLSLLNPAARKKMADNLVKESGDTDSMIKIIDRADRYYEAAGIIDSGEFRAKEALLEIGNRFDFGERKSEIEDLANKLDQTYSPPIVHDFDTQTSKSLLNKIIPGNKTDLNRPASILLPETILKIRKKAREVLIDTDFEKLNVDLFEPDIDFKGLEYLESEFESMATMKLSPQEIQEVIEELSKRGISKKTVDKALKNVLRKAVGQKKEKISQLKTLIER